MKIILHAATIMLVCAIMLTSCSVTLNTDELLKPPKLNETQQSLYNELISYASTGNAELEYPQSGAYRSAFVLFDLNSDSVNEEIVFYKSKDTGSTAMQICVFSKLSGTGNWTVISDTAGQSIEIDKISFVNMDGKCRLVVGWMLYAGDEKKLSVYELDGNDLRLVYSDTYISFVTGDFNNNLYDEIITINRVTSEGYSTYENSSRLEATYSKLIRMVDGEISTYSKCSLLNTVISYPSVIVGKVDDNHFGVFIDGLTGVDTRCTQVLMTDSDGKLVNPMMTTNETVKTIRTGTISCRDYNADGITEIPVSVFSGRSEASSPDAAWKTLWYTVSDGVLVFSAATYTSIQNSFVFTFPDAWDDSIVIKRDAENNSVSFSKPVSGIYTDILIIKIVSQKKYREIPTGYFEICRSAANVYIATIPIASAMGDSRLTKNEVKTNFVVE